MRSTGSTWQIDCFVTATTLRLLGGPIVERAGTALAVPLNTPTSLLFYLAASGDWVPRSELAYLYRPDEPESEALAYLRLQVHRAQALPWAEGLEAEPQRLRWRVASDLADLRAAGQAGRWREVTAIYDGPLLGALELRGRPTFNAWLELERDACQRLYAGALRQEAARWDGVGEHTRSAELYGRLAALDEFDEAAVHALVRSLALAGERDEALRRHAAFAQLLADELGVKPTAEFEALARAVHAGAVGVPDEEAGAKRPRRGPTPQPATRFIGRRAELAELTRLLALPECRLVGIVGIGGSGKTRLALELRRTLAGHYLFGTTYVSLEAVDSAAQAVAHVAHALGVEPDAQEDLEAELLAHLAEKEMLLLLDNLEQLPDLAGFIASALAAAPELRIVSTSRVALRLRGEWLFDLGGLDVPDADSEPSEESSAALELFVSAARRVAPLKEFTPAELQDSARICRQVDGLPLALELAAAWVRAVPVARIADGLERDLSLLSSDAVDLPERQRSVTTILERTWADLGAGKRDVLMRLAVFRGGLALEAGEVVSGAGLPVLLSLVNQSLLSRSASGRLTCHPLVAQFARAQLRTDDARLAAALDAHADYFCVLLERYHPRNQARRVREQRSGADATADLAQAGGFSWRDLEPDDANLEQAWFRLLETRRYESMAAVADSLMAFYNTLGFYQRGAEVAARTVAALATDDRRASTELRCVLTLVLSNMTRERGQLQESLEQAEAALALARTLAVDEHAATALRYRGDALQMLGNYESARESYEQAIAILEALADEQELANTLNSLASMQAVREEFAAATAGFLRCVALFEATGDELSKAIAFNNLGYIADAQGDTQTASRHYEDSLAAFERIQFTRGISAVKNNLVVLYGMLGRLEEAERMGLESLAIKERSNDRLGIIITLKNLGDLRLLQGRAEDAFGFLESALATAMELDATPRLLQVLPSYAQALLEVGSETLAQRVLSALLRHPLATPSQRQKGAQLATGLGVAAEPPDASLLDELLAELPFAR